MRRRSWSIAFVSVAALMLVTLNPGSGSASAVTYKTIHVFTGGADGSRPWGSQLILDASGNLYGTTYLGGTLGCGVVFKLSHSTAGGWIERVLHSFTGGADGCQADAGLIFDAAGNLYGATAGGGIYGHGVVFKLQPLSGGNWRESVLYSFTGGADGAAPVGTLLFDDAGNLYGTTSAGGGATSPDCQAYTGDMGCGTVFELTPNSSGSWQKQVLHVFTSGGDGSMPFAKLIFDNAGNLFGTSAGQCSNPNLGSVFELTPNADGTWTESVIHQGGCPTSDLIFDAAGNLYGTTWNDGISDGGTVFQMVPAAMGGWEYHVLHQFSNGYNPKEGSNPYGGVTFDVAGNLFGTTVNGGIYGYGLVFKLTHRSSGAWQTSPVWPFRGHPGEFPYSPLVFDSAGNIYGTTSGDGTANFGIVFEITP